MNKFSAIHSFFSGFGLTAYEENSVYATAPPLPYLTYEIKTDVFGNSVNFTCSLWYKTPSWVEINRKTEEISRKIGTGGVILDCDGGHIWLKRATPFAMSMGDDLIKRKILNFTAEFFTAD